MYIKRPFPNNQVPNTTLGPNPITFINVSLLYAFPNKHRKCIRVTLQNETVKALWSYVA